MKRVLLVIAVFLLGVSLSHAQTKVNLRISVEKEQKTKRDVTQKGHVEDSWDRWSVTPEVAEQSRQIVMAIKIQNMSGVELRGLTVKYIVFSRDKGAKDAKLAQQGQQTTDLKSLQTATVRTEPCDFKSREETYHTGSFKGQNTGEEYFGTAVTVYRGDEKLATFAEPTTLEQQMTKLGVHP